MIRASSTEFRARFGAFVDRALETPIMVQRYGQDAVVFLAPEEYERLVSLAAVAGEPGDAPLPFSESEEG